MALSLGDLFDSESAFGQILIWGVGQQILNAVMAPGLNELTQLISEAAQTEVLSPAILADLVVRNFLDINSATATAAKSGVTASDFALMVSSSGDALDTTTLMEAYRRKIIGFSGAGPSDTTVEAGIREGRLADKWIPVLQGLGTVPIGVADAVDAVVENQISFADGQQYAYENGLEPDAFQILVNTRGNPPAPTDLETMVRRGLIPVDGTGPDVLSFVQGISEGATKDKWIPVLKQMMTTLVPEGTISTMLRDGAIDNNTALSWFQLLGYDQTASEAFVTQAFSQRTTQDKALAKSDILALYADAAVSASDATGMLVSIGYDQADAAYILAIQDMHGAATAANAAITKIRTYYVARKITSQSVVTSLDSLGVPPAQRDKLLNDWNLERTSDVKILTESNITDAWAYGIMDQNTAMAELQSLGYTPYDAWVVLSVKNKAPLDGEPSPGVIPSS